MVKPGWNDVRKYRAQQRAGKQDPHKLPTLDDTKRAVKGTENTAKKQPKQK